MAISLLVLLIDIDEWGLNLINIVTHAGIAVVFFIECYDVFYIDYERTAIAQDGLTLSVWVLVVCMLVLFVARTPSGSLWSAGYYYIFIGFGLSRFVSDAGAGIIVPAYQALMQQYLYTGVLLLLLFTFMRLKCTDMQNRLETEQLRKHANTDYLTGLPNRRKMTALIEQALERAQRYSHPFSIILFDLDHFKNVNDNHGHDVGDKVLCRISAIVAENVRKVDRVGRWGGEEFLILAPEADLTHATQYARRLKHLMAEYDHDPAGTVTASFGVATYCAGDTLHDTLKRADRALYQAKELGRNRVVAMQLRDTGMNETSEKFTATPGGWTSRTAT